MNKSNTIIIHVRKLLEAHSKLLLSWSISPRAHSEEKVTWPDFLENGHPLHFNPVLSLNAAFLKLKAEVEGSYDKFKFIFHDGNQIEGSFNTARTDAKHYTKLTQWERKEFYSVIKLSPEKFHIIRSENQPV